MKSLTWTRRAIKEGAVVALQAADGCHLLFEATLERARGGGGGEPLTTGAFTTPEAALEDLESRLKEEAAAATAAGGWISANPKHY